MDSRATFREIAFRTKLTIVTAIFGALVGAIVYFLYITDGHSFDFERYFSLLQDIFTEPEYRRFRLNMLLSSMEGALIATLPITFTYARD